MIHRFSAIEPVVSHENMAWQIVAISRTDQILPAARLVHAKHHTRQGRARLVCG